MRHCWKVLALGGALCALAGATPRAQASRPEAPSQTADAAGLWEGEARVPEATLALTVALTHDASGWRGTVDVPSQYARQYPLADVAVGAGRIAFRFPETLPPAAFDGAVERGRIHGRFTSGEGAGAIAGTFELWRRPPGTAPYTAEPVRFQNGEIALAGTLHRPRAAGPHPGIVFVHGSGPQTRDSYLRWFADRFARAGFVALIYDKRGTGDSGGEPWPRTAGAFSDLAGDAAAAVRFLRAQPGVDAGRIGLWGLSQGAWIVPLAATRAPDSIAFLVVLSGGGVSPAEQELYDDEVKLRDLGFEPTAIDEALAYLRLADQYIRTGTDEDWDRFGRAREQARTRPWYPHLDRFPQILPREAPVWRGLKADLDYDPAPILAKVRVPVLLILGEDDRLTPARETAVRVRGALERGGNRALRTVLIPGADHGLMVKPAPTAPWLAQRPAGNWVGEMIDWARGGR